VRSSHYSSGTGGSTGMQAGLTTVAPQQSSQFFLSFQRGQGKVGRACRKNFLHLTEMMCFNREIALAFRAGRSVGTPGLPARPPTRPGRSMDAAKRCPEDSHGRRVRYVHFLKVVAVGAYLSCQGPHGGTDKRVSVFLSDLRLGRIPNQI